MITSRARISEPDATMVSVTIIAPASEWKSFSDQLSAVDGEKWPWWEFVSAIDKAARIAYLAYLALKEEHS